MDPAIFRAFFGHIHANTCYISHSGTPFFWRPGGASFFVHVVPVPFLKDSHGGIEVNGVQLQFGSFRPFQDLRFTGASK